MFRIGQILIREQLATENSVARALGVQHFAGGRLGTLLLERGSVAEDELGRALAIQHGCEYIPWQILGNVSPAVISGIPARFAVRHAAIPFDRAESYLRVALRDPADLRILDELFFVTGRKIIPCVAPEVRIYQGLEKYYGERRTPRFAILAEKLSRPVMRASRPPASVSVPPPPAFFGAPPQPAVPPPPGFSETPSGSSGPLPHEVWGDTGEEGSEPPIIQSWRVPDLPVVPWTSPTTPEPDVERQEVEMISWEEMAPSAPLWISEDEAATRIAQAAQPPFLSSELPNPPYAETAAASAPFEPVLEESAPAPVEESAPATSPQPPPEPAPPPRSPAASEPTALRGFDFSDVIAARDRDSIGQAVLGAMSRRFLRVALFAAKPDAVTGWAAAGDRVRDGSIRRVEIPWTEPSVFLNVRFSRAFYLGPLPPLPRHDAIAEAMGGAIAQECLVQPVLIREKPVAFLYAEFPPQRGATPLDLAYLRELAAATAAALAASIRLKKKPVI
jgi:type II secretion system (T2SS) protein E